MSDNTIASPTRADIEAAIRALGGKGRNDIYLHPDGDDPESYLCVGGGDGGYIASGSVANERFPT